MRVVGAIAVAAMVGCSSSPPVADMSVDLAVADQAMAIPIAKDLSVASSIGGPCTTTDDCSEGSSRVCWTKTLYNKLDTFPTPGGYCSSTCTDDNDCGANGVCVTEGSSGKFCFAPCAQPSDCRTGFACFESYGGHCYPNAGLDCDPTVPGGLCMDGSACIRYTLGTGKTGYCLATCEVGPGTCPTVDGYVEQCFVWNRTLDTDPSGVSQNDQFNGPVCADVGMDNADGTECLYEGEDYIFECVDGDECWLGTGGDHKCHQLCNPGSADGGVRDGGALVTCATGTCKDVFGLFNSKTPIGLCL